MSIIEKKVYTNSELRDTLEFHDLNDDTIESVEINLNLKRMATYESGINYIDLEYKGYKYEIHGYYVEKRNDPELYYYDDDESEKESNKISVFLEKIQDKEISVLEDYLDFNVNGEPDSWWPNNTLNEESLEAVKWIDDAPNSIKAEFEKNYRDNDYQDVIHDGITDYDGEVLFFEEHNNISNIYFKINSKGINYEIEWINK